MRKDLGQSSINKSPVNSNSLAPLSLASCLCHYSCTGLLKWMLLNGWHCQWIIYWLWFSLLFLLTWLNSVYLDISFFFFFSLACIYSHHYDWNWIEVTCNRTYPESLVRPVGEVSMGGGGRRLSWSQMAFLKWSLKTWSQSPCDGQNCRALL